MADQKISELTSAAALTAADILPIVQGGVTKKITVAAALSSLPSKVVEVEPAESPASGALSLLIKSSTVSAATEDVNYTLASGTAGQVKEIVALSIGVTFKAIVTVTGGKGVSSIHLTAAGQTVTLKFIGGFWYVMSSNGATINA